MPTSTSILTCVVTWFFSDITFFCQTMELHLFFCYSGMSLIYLTYLWQICIFIPLDPWMFLKVLNKANFTALKQTSVISYYWLTPILFTKLLELLAINHSFVWKEDNFCSLVFEVLPCSGCFITCMGGHFPAVELDNAIQFSTLSRMSGFLWHSPKWARWFSHFLQYMPGLEVLACTLDTDHNYVTAILQLCLSLNH